MMILNKVDDKLAQQRAQKQANYYLKRLHATEPFSRLIRPSVQLQNEPKSGFKTSSLQIILWCGLS